jgi:hypothetical protein
VMSTGVSTSGTNKGAAPKLIRTETSITSAKPPNTMRGPGREASQAAVNARKGARDHSKMKPYGAGKPEGPWSCHMLAVWHTSVPIVAPFEVMVGDWQPV